MTTDSTPPPEALLFITTQCPHCPTILQHLSDMIKAGEISQLQVIHLEQAPTLAQQYGVRSVPWVKIGEAVLTGLQEKSALQQRAAWAKQSTLLVQFDNQLSNGQVNQVIEYIQQQPESLSIIIELLADSATVLSTRIGIGVIMEELAQHTILLNDLPALLELTQHQDARIRADVCYYLELINSPEAIPTLQHCLQDDNIDVREAAMDALQALSH